MRSPSLAAFYLAWGFMLIVISVSAVPYSSIIDATNDKYNLLHSRQLESSSSNPPLTMEQFDLCLTDIKLADANLNSQLDRSEYILFLSLNSANYGYSWGDASEQFTLDTLPLEFVMLFHSTACICAYEQDSASADFGCCMGTNEHVVVYDATGSNMTEAQVAYTRIFCSEAYYSYSVTVSPTKSPVDMTIPPTLSPAVSTILPTDVAPGTSPPTPTMTSPVVPTSAAPGATTPPTTIVTDIVTSPAPIPRGSIVPTILPVPTALTTPPPVSVSPSTSTTLSPISTSITNAPLSTSISMSPTASFNILRIVIEYGISSDCGMTADDVINNNYGITIKDGLITATEVVLVDILNSTYPREDAQNSTDGVVETLPTMPPVADSESDPFLPPAVDSDNMSMPPTTVPESNPFLPPAAGGATKKSLKTLKNVRIRVKGLPSGPLKVVDDNGDLPNRRRGLAMLDASQSQHQLLLKNGQRSLVYYTELNPIIITDVEDVLVEACQQGFVCMKVMSTVSVTLEEGDVADEVEAVIRDGFQKSIDDASFFNSMPIETIVCPPLGTAPTTVPVNTSEPTAPHSEKTQSPIRTTAPIPMTPSATPLPFTTTSTGSPLSGSVLPLTPPPMASTVPPTFSMDLSLSMPDLGTSSPSPVAVLSTPSPIATVPGSLLPFPTVMTRSPSAGSEEALAGPMNVTIQYSFNNDCGLDAEAIMNEEGNMFKDVLINVTTTATVQILNETFPRVEEEMPAERRGVRVQKRRLVHLDNPTSTSLLYGQQNRKLVYFADEYPVTIDRMIDIESCDPGFNCILVISVITVVLEAGDDPTQVSEAIVIGITDSFEDGSIYSTIPPESLECPDV